MITKFDSLYAGHIDMDDIGYAGTAVNDRKFDNDHLMTVYSKAEAIAKAPVSYTHLTLPTILLV